MFVSRNNISAVVVVYNYDVQMLLNNILTYCNQVHKVYVVDNSDKDNGLNQKSFDIIGNAVYISMRGNKGIAAALNVGVEHSAKENYLWILTMDQDSRVESDMISNMLDFINSNQDRYIAMVVPQIKWSEKYEVNVNKPDYEFVTEAISSGSLCSVDAIVGVGMFDNDLFIDNVDTEMCWRLRHNGYKIVMLNNIVLNHLLGDIVPIRLLGKYLFSVTNHNYIRRYYITRNALYVKKKYKHIYPNDLYKLSSVYKDFIKIVLFENDKVRKIKSILCGVKDYRRNVYGKKMK